MIGDKMQFSFDSREWKIIDEVDNPEIGMWWERGKKVCPHCKEIIVNRVFCNFFKIDVFIPSSLEKPKSINDILMLGASKEGGTLLLTKDKMKEVLSSIEKLKYLGDLNG